MISDIDWDAVATMSPTVRAMRGAVIPLTRENFMDAKYGSEVPDPWDEDHEIALPLVFQHAG